MSKQVLIDSMKFRFLSWLPLPFFIQIFFFDYEPKKIIIMDLGINNSLANQTPLTLIFVCHQSSLMYYLLLFFIFLWIIFKMMKFTKQKITQIPGLCPWLIFFVLYIYWHPLYPYLRIELRHKYTKIDRT